MDCLQTSFVLYRSGLKLYTFFGISIGIKRRMMDIKKTSNTNAQKTCILKHFAKIKNFFAGFCHSPIYSHSGLDIGAPLMYRSRDCTNAILRIKKYFFLISRTLEQIGINFVNQSTPFCRKNNYDIKLATLPLSLFLPLSVTVLYPPPPTPPNNSPYCSFKSPTVYYSIPNWRG